MTDRSSTTRRAILAGLLGAPALLAPMKLFAAQPLTPRQVMGPFYPLARQVAERTGPWRDTDLCTVPDGDGQARGTQALLHGVVTDAAGRPAPGARVEIWQACDAGRYLNANDTRHKRLRDPNFQYWGVCPLDEQGRYAFRTIVPPEYPAGPPGWIRPPHVHVRVLLPGHRPFVTQMYFDDPAHPDNAEVNHRLHRLDAILRQVPRALRPAVVRPVTLLSETSVPEGPAADLLAAIGPGAFGEAARVVDFPIVPRQEIVQP